MWARLVERRLLSAAIGLVVVCAAPGAARAAEDAEPAREARPPIGRLAGGLLVVGSDYGGAIGMEGSALLRGSVLAIGLDLSAEAKPTLGGYVRYAAGLQAGFVVPIGEDVDLDLLGSAGGAHYANVDSGSGWFAPGASGSLPYAGARTGLSFTLKRERRATLKLGVWAIYTNEIGRTPGSVYTHCGFFNCEGQHSVNVGTPRYGGAIGVVVNLP